MPEPAEDLMGHLERVAHLRGYPADSEVLGRLLAWVDALLGLAGRPNLTAAKTRAEAVDVLVVSALAVAKAVAEPPRRALDLGTGNGLPGVAVALAWPRAHVVLLERRRRKAEAVARLLERVGIANAEVLCADGRDVLRERPEIRGGLDLVTVRAVGDLASTTTLAAPWLAPGGRIVHWKGRALSAAELAAGSLAARGAGLDELGRLAFSDDAGPAFLVTYELPVQGPRGGAKAGAR